MGFIDKLLEDRFIDPNNIHICEHISSFAIAFMLNNVWGNGSFFLWWNGSFFPIMKINFNIHS